MPMWCRFSAHHPSIKQSEATRRQFQCIPSSSPCLSRLFDSGLTFLCIQLSILLLLLPLAVFLCKQFGAPNQPTVYIETAPELEWTDVMSFAEPDCIDPDAHHIGVDFGKRYSDQQAQEMLTGFDLTI